MVSTSQVLRFMGFESLTDFEVHLIGEQEEVRWFRASTQPTQEQIDAARPAAEVWVARKAICPVTRRQMLTALYRTGLLNTIKSAVAASGNVELQIAFDESQEFLRDNAFLASMAQALGKTDADIDAIFALAATL